MSHSTVSSVPFIGFTAIVVMASATALAASWPAVQAQAHAESARLVGEAAAAKPAEALNNYQLAVWLDPFNPTTNQRLADALIRTGQAEAAISPLKRAGEGSGAANLRLRADIELGRTEPAAGLTTLIGPQTSPEAADRLARVNAGKLPLAQELYASGLPESASALLVKLPTSFERNLLLARINYDFHTKNSLATAADYLSEAVALNPSDLPAHQLYAAVLTDQGRSDDSARQSDFAKKLQLGRP